MKLRKIPLWVEIMNKHVWTPRGPAPHIQTARANLCSHFLSAPLQRAAVTQLYGRSPCQVFQAHSQGRGSGLKARSLVKYLNYVIDVSTVINLAVAHPSGCLLPTQFLGRLWSSCQTGTDDGDDDGACVFWVWHIFVEAHCFDKSEERKCWKDQISVTGVCVRRPRMIVWFQCFWAGSNLLVYEQFAENTLQSKCYMTQFYWCR